MFKHWLSICHIGYSHHGSFPALKTSNHEFCALQHAKFHLFRRSTLFFCRAIRTNPDSIPSCELITSPAFSSYYQPPFFPAEVSSPTCLVRTWRICCSTGRWGSSRASRWSSAARPSARARHWRPRRSWRWICCRCRAARSDASSAAGGRKGSVEGIFGTWKDEFEGKKTLIFWACSVSWSVEHERKLIKHNNRNDGFWPGCWILGEPWDSSSNKKGGQACAKMNRNKSHLQKGTNRKDSAEKQKQDKKKQRKKNNKRSNNETTKQINEKHRKTRQILQRRGHKRNNEKPTNIKNKRQERQISPDMGQRQRN